MTDEFQRDCARKRAVAASARRRVRGSRSRKVSLPSDSLTPAQLRRRCGPVRTFRLGTPMDWAAFQAMPPDLQREYLTAVQSRFGADGAAISRQLFGQPPAVLEARCREIGLTLNAGQEEDGTAWRAWLRGEGLAEALLREPGEAAEALASARRKLEAWLSRCRRMTATYGAGGGRRGAMVSGEEAWAETADLAAEVRRRQGALREARERLETLLTELAAEGERGERSALLLRQRYLLSQAWPRVREALAQGGYSAGTERTVFNWHREAIRQAEELLGKAGE